LHTLLLGFCVDFVQAANTSRRPSGIFMPEAHTSRRPSGTFMPFCYLMFKKKKKKVVVQKGV